MYKPLAFRLAGFFKLKARRNGENQQSLQALNIDICHWPENYRRNIIEGEKY